MCRIVFQWRRHRFGVWNLLSFFSVRPSPTRSQFSHRIPVLQHNTVNTLYLYCPVKKLFCHVKRIMSITIFQERKSVKIAIIKPVRQHTDTCTHAYTHTHTHTNHLTHQTHQTNKNTYTDWGGGGRENRMPISLIFLQWYSDVGKKITAFYQLHREEIKNSWVLYRILFR